jgi:hypothetical protein
MDNARIHAFDNEGAGDREQTPTSPTHRRLEVVGPPSEGLCAELEIFTGFGGLASINRCRAELRPMAGSPGDRLAQMQSDYEGIAREHVERSCALRGHRASTRSSARTRRSVFERMPVVLVKDYGMPARQQAAAPQRVGRCCCRPQDASAQRARGVRAERHERNVKRWPAIVVAVVFQTLTGQTYALQNSPIGIDITPQLLAGSDRYRLHTENRRARPPSPSPTAKPQIMPARPAPQKTAITMADLVAAGASAVLTLGLLGSVTTIDLAAFAFALVSVALVASATPAL